MLQPAYAYNLTRLGQMACINVFLERTVTNVIWPHKTSVVCMEIFPSCEVSNFKRQEIEMTSFVYVNVLSDFCLFLCEAASIEIVHVLYLFLRCAL